MKEAQIIKAYEAAKERYAQIGIDTDEALKKLQNISLSLHCWQTDDVTGFENPDGQLSGGIQATGNYPGKARNIEEVRKDIEKAKSLIPGSHRLSIHAIYGDFGGKKVDRNEIEPKHFQSWIDWAKANDMKLDFNSTSFSHPLSGDQKGLLYDFSQDSYWVDREPAWQEPKGLFSADGRMIGIPYNPIITGEYEPNTILVFIVNAKSAHSKRALEYAKHFVKSYEWVYNVIETGWSDPDIEKKYGEHSICIYKDEVDW